MRPSPSRAAIAIAAAIMRGLGWLLVKLWQLITPRKKR